MFASDPAAFRRQLATMEDRMLAAFRPVTSEPGPPRPAGPDGPEVIR
jgi:hypothetical protein